MGRKPFKGMNGDKRGKTTNVVPKGTYSGSHIIPSDPDYDPDAVDPAKLALRGLHPGPEGNFTPTRELLGEK